MKITARFSSSVPLMCVHVHVSISRPWRFLVLSYSRIKESEYNLLTCPIFVISVFPSFSPSSEIKLLLLMGKSSPVY